MLWHATTPQQYHMMMKLIAEVVMGWHGKFLWGGNRNEIMHDGVG